MKMRNLIIGLVAVAFVAGGYLGGFVPKLGFGPGGGGFGLGGGGGSSPAADPSSDNHTLVSQSKERPPPVEDSRVVQVRIDSREYFLLSGAHSSVPATLEQIVGRAVAAPGDGQGIRVRVQRRPNSKTTAEIALRDALAEAGIAEDAIEWRDGPPP